MTRKSVQSPPRFLRPVGCLIFAAILSAILPGIAAAQDYWTAGGTDGSWSDASNWSPSVPGSGDTAIFNVPAVNGYQPIDLGVGVTVNTIIFDTGADPYFIGTSGSESLTINNGGAITMTSGVTNNETVNAGITLGDDGTTQSFTVTNNAASAYSLNFSGNITGSSGGAGTQTLSFAGSGLTSVSGNIIDSSSGGTGIVAVAMNGTGTVTLSGTNSYSGATTVNSGVLEFTNSAPATAGGILINSGGTAAFGNGTAVLTSGTLSSIATASAGTVALAAGSSANLNFSTAGLNSLSLGAVGSVTYTGTITPAGGTYRLGGGGGTLSYIPSSSTAFTGTSSLVIGGGGSGGTVILNNGSANTYTGSTTIDAGILEANTSTSFSSSSAVILANTGTELNLNNQNNSIGSLTGVAGSSVVLGSGTLTIGGDNTTPAAYAGTISGAAGITKTGWGTLTLSGANQYYGETLVNEGVVQAQNASALGLGNNTTVNAAGAAVQLDNISSSMPFFLSGTGLSTGGALQATGAGSSTAGGPITLNAISAIGATPNSTLNVTGGISGPFALTFNAASGGTINVNTASIAANVPSISILGGGNVNFGTGGSSATDAAIAVDSGTLTISGTDALAASSGTISVSAVAVGGNTAAVTLSSATLPAGFGIGSTLLGQMVYAINGTKVTLTGPYSGSAGNDAFVGALAIQPDGVVDLTSTAGNLLGGRDIYFAGGTLNMSGGATTETTGAALFAPGESVIDNTSGSSLNLGTLAPGHVFGGSALFEGGSQISFGATPAFTGGTGGNGTLSKAILPWAVIPDPNLASYGSGNGYSFATTDSSGTVVRYLAGTQASPSEFTNALTAGDNAVLTTNPATVTGSGVSVNSIDLDTATAVTISTPTTLSPAAAAVDSLTSASGGVIANPTSSTISGGELAVNTGYFFAPTGSTLTISSDLVASGFIKSGGGTVVLSSTSPAYPGFSGNNITSTNGHSGGVFINQGTVRLGANNGFIAAFTATSGNAGPPYSSSSYISNDGPTISVNAGGTLDLNGYSQFVGALLSTLSDPNTDTAYVPGTTGGIITSSTGYGNLLIAIGNPSNAVLPFNFGGSIQGANVGLAMGGAGTSTGQVLSGANTFGGPTLINGGGTTAAAGFILEDNGTLSNTSEIDINGGALVLNDAGLYNNNNRVNDAAPVNFRNGYLYFTGRAATDSTETLGAVTAALGGSSVTLAAGASGGYADLTFSSLASQEGVMAFNLGSSTHVNITGATGMVNGIIPFAVAGTAVNNPTNFMTYTPYTSVNGVSSGGLVAQPASNYLTSLPTNVNAPTTNYDVSNNPFTITTSAVNINSLVFNSYQNIAFASSTDLLNLTSGGLIVQGSVNNTIGATVDSGQITAGGTASTGTASLYVYSQNSSFALNARIVDNPNGARVQLVDSGNLYEFSNANNSYTGGTVINNTSLILYNASSGVVIPNAFTPANGLVLNTATVTLTNSPGQIGSSNIVTLNGGSTLNLFGNNTLAGLVLNNTGSSGDTSPIVNTTPNAFAANTSSSGITLTLTGSTAITTTSNEVGSNPQTTTIDGLVSLPSSTTLSIAAATFNGSILDPLLPDLIVTGLTGGGGTITKSGTGVLQFNAMTTLTGTLDVTAGGIQIGVANAGARLADLKLESGTWLNLNDYASTFGSLAGSGEVTNILNTTNALTVGFDNNSTTFSGSFQVYNDAVINVVNLTKIGSGTLNLTGTGSTASGTLTLNSTGGGGVTFSGYGVNNFVSGAIAVNEGSTLTLDNTQGISLSNRLSNAAVTLNGGNFTFIAASAGSSETSTGALTLGTGESTLTLNQGNTAAVVTFASLTQSAAGSTANFVSPNLGTASTDMFTFTSSSGLTSGALLPRDAVNSSNFATWTALTGIEALPASSYTSLPNINSGASGNTVETSSMTNSTTLTAPVSLNAINFNNTGIGATPVTIGASGVLPTAGLTIASGALLVNGNSDTISTPELALGAEGIFRVNGAGFDVASAITGSSGLTKTGSGDMTISTAAAYTGATSINAGTLNLAGGNNTLMALPPAATANSIPTVYALNVNGGTLNLDGNNQLVGAITSANPYTGGTITNTSGTAATLYSYDTGANTFGGTITGNLNLTLYAAGGYAGNLTTLESPQSYTGATVVHNGQLILQGAGALYSGVSNLTNASITLNQASLVLDNSGLNPGATPPTRVPSTVPITLNSAMITTIPAASTSTSTTLGTVTAASGLNVIAPISANGTTGTVLANTDGATNVLTINNLQNTANGGLMNLYDFNGTGSYVNSAAETLFINNVNGSPVVAGQMLPAWIGIGNGTIGGTMFTDFATLSSTGYGIVRYGDTALGGPGYAGTFGSGLVTSVGVTTLSSNTTTGALVLTGALTFGSSSTYLNLESGGLITHGYSIGSAIVPGVLTAGGTASSGTTDLILANAVNGAATAVTIYSTIEDTSTVLGSGTANVRLNITGGNAALTLAGNNTYTGGTIITGGGTSASVVLGGSGQIIPPGGLTLYPNLVSTTQVALSAAPGQIAASNNVTIMGSGYGLTLTGGTNTTLNSLTFDNVGGGTTSASTSPLVTISGSGTNLILTQTTANGSVISSENDSLSSIPNIQGTQLTIPDGSTITTSGTAPTDLLIAAPLATAASTTPLNKNGTGSVEFTAANTFANGVNLNAGTIIFTASSTGGGTGGASPTSSQIGTGTLTMGNNTAIMGTSSVTIGNVVSLANNAAVTLGTLSTTDVTANATNDITLTNTVNLSGNNTINVNGLLMVGTLSGQLTGTANLTKGGPGELLLSSTSNNYDGSTAITGGLLQSGATNALPTTTDLSISSGAAFNMATFSQTINSLSGAGLLYSPGTSTQTLTIGGTSATNGSFSGSIYVAGTSTVDLALIKLGSNTETLSGPSNYTGTTMVNGGTLALVPGVSLGLTTITVNTGTFAAYPGSGTIALPSKLALSIGTNFTMVDGSAGTFSVNSTSGYATGLKVSAATLSFDIVGNGVTTAVDRLNTNLAYLDADTADLSTIDFVASGSSLQAGSYTFITAASGMSNLDFQLGTPTVYAGGTPYNLTLSGSTTAEVLTVTPGYTIAVSWSAPVSGLAHRGGSATVGATLMNDDGSNSLGAGGYTVAGSDSDTPSGTITYTNPASVAIAAGQSNAYTFGLATSNSTPLGASTITLTASGGALNPQDAPYTTTTTLTVYSGQSTWAGSGGGSWGTFTGSGPGAFGVNWGNYLGSNYEGSPGLDLSFVSTDTATFDSTAASPGGTVYLNGASPSLLSLTFNDSAASYTIAQGNGGTLTLDGGTGPASITVLSGTHTISVPTITLATNTNVVVTNSSDSLTISGNIGESPMGQSLTLSGAGTLILSGTNSYTGGTTITSGTLRVAAISDSGTSNIGDSSGPTNNILTLGGGTLQYTGSGAASTGRNVALTGNSSIVVSGGSGASLALNGTLSGTGNLTLDTGTTGTLILGNGANSYGTTTVNAGTLRVTNLSGSATGSGSVSVASGAVLGGSGTIAGSVTVAGTVQPSVGTNSPTTLTLGGGLTLSNGAVLALNVSNNPSLNDVINLTGVAGNLTLNTGTLDILPGGGELTTNTDYPLIDFTGSAPNGIGSFTVANSGGDSGHNYEFIILTGTGPNGSNQFDLVPVTNSVYGSSSWIGNSGGLYSNQGSWYQNTIPNGPTQTATFVNASVTTLAQTVTIDSTYTVGTLTFTSGTNFTLESLNGGTSLTLDNGGGVAKVNLTNSTVSLQTSLILADSSGSTTFTIDPTSHLFVSSYNGTNTAISSTGTQALTLAGGGTMEFASPNSYSGGTTVEAGSTLQVDDGSNIGTGGLTITGTGVNGASNATFLTASSHTVAIGGTLELDNGGTLNMSSGDGTGTLTVSGQPKLNGGAINVNAGTLAFTNTVAASGTGAVTVTVSPGATLQLAGSASAFTSATTVINQASAAGTTGGLQVSGGSQTVGVITGAGTLVNSATTYDGDTVVSGGANLTATQILQNTLTINAGSTVMIAPAVVVVTAQPAAQGAVASVSSSGTDSTSDPFTAIQAAIASGSITNATGQRLEDRIAAIESLAAADPKLDASLLEDRVLATIPSASILSATDSAPSTVVGSSLLALDSSTIGSGSALESATAAFAPSASFAGSPAAVPEPSTLLLALLAGLGSIAAVRRRAIRRG